MRKIYDGKSEPIKQITETYALLSVTNKNEKLLHILVQNFCSMTNHTIAMISNYLYYTE